jgi:cytochrome c biogenesis protein CcmG/thiol:disulfide interchange protein DsbE
MFLTVLLSGWMRKEEFAFEGVGLWEDERMVELQSTTRGSRKGMYIFVGAAVLVSAILSIPWPRRAEPLIAVGERKALTEVALTQLEGGTWRLTEHRGKVVLINYWASWCGPCRTETPGLVRLAEEMGPERLAVVGVAMDTGEKGPVRAFVNQMHVGYPIAFPEPMSQMAQAMVGLPTTILVDRQGRVAKTYVGETREAEFRGDVERLLGESL